jgi:hypothetical protein
VKNAKIVLVAEWDGWCGACGADRPLVLTRTGRQRVRTWLTAAADDSRPLTLTCRLCGTGVDVPLEQDDPPVIVDVEASTPVDAPLAVAGAAPSVAGDVVSNATAHPAVPLEAPAAVADVTAGRQVVAQAFGALLAQRSAAVSLTKPAEPPVPGVAPLLPLQRTASSGGLAELQLLADGIDLLSAGRS